MGLIVSIHEFGHLIAAKIFGVYVLEYSVGMGPKLISKKTKETEYCLRVLPLGGFCMLAGDETNDPSIDEKTKDVPMERRLIGIARWKRAIIMFAGIFMNFVLSLVIVGLIILSNGSYGVSSKAIVKEVNKDMPAYKAGFKENDLIEKISFENGTSIKPKNYNELASFLDSYDGNGSWEFIVNRDSEEVSIIVDPIKDDELGYIVGISFDSYKYKETNIFNCWHYACDYLGSILKLTVVSLISLFRGVGLENISGPVGIYKVIEDSVSYGFSYYLQIVAILSINIAVMNALPLPAFDGGRVLILIVESIINKPLNKKFENAIMAISMAILLAFTIYITFKDIIKLF